jgi:hypothetical protein
VAELTVRWVRVQTNVLDHPKFVGLPAHDLGFWLRCLIWCGEQERADIPESVLDRIGVTRSAAARLAARGLLDHASTGWRLHDYDEWQDSRQYADARSAWRARQAAHRERQRQQGDSEHVTRDMRDPEKRREEKSRAETHTPPNPPSSGGDVSVSRKAARRRDYAPENPIDRRIRQTLEGKRR